MLNDVVTKTGKRSFQDYCGGVVLEHKFSAVKIKQVIGRNCFYILFCRRHGTYVLRKAALRKSEISGSKLIERKSKILYHRKTSYRISDFYKIFGF